MALKRVAVSVLFLSCLFSDQQTLKGQLLEQAVLTAPDAGPGDWFGFAIAEDSNFMVVTAYLDDDKGSNSACDSGAAYIYQGSVHSGWVFLKKIYASDGYCGQKFGVTVALLGDVLVVGADLTHLSPGAATAGAVYVYYKDEGGVANWGEKKKIVASDSMAGAQFGGAIALTGERLAVAAAQHASLCPGGAQCAHGAVYVFERNGGGVDNWGEVKKIIPTDVAQYDYFGTSVALEGDRLAVGSSGDDSGCAPINPTCDAGAVYVFERNHGGIGMWGQTAELLADDGRYGGRSGWALDLEGTRLAATAVFGDGAASNSGVARIWEQNELGVWDWSTTMWPTSGTTQAWFGTAIALEQNRVYVGARFAAGGAPNTGAAYLFLRGVDGAWSESSTLQASDGQDGDYFGAAIESTANGLLIGARQDDGACPTNPECNSGSVYVFDFSLLSDGFEPGDACAWSAAVGGGCP